MSQDVGEVPVHTELPKDSIEHLRTVHFTLVAVSLALIVLSTSNKNGAISNARSQMARIIQLSRNWHDDWINKEFEQLASNRTSHSSIFISRSPQTIIKFQANDKKGIIALLFKGPNWTINTKDDDFEIQFGNCAPASLTKRPRTLENFRVLWDDLNKDLLFKIPTELDNHPIILKDTDSNIKDILSAEFVDQKAKYPTINLTLAASIRQFGLSKGKGMFYGSEGEKLNNFGTIIVNIPVTASQTIPFDGQNALIARFPQWRHGAFAHSFTTLYEITKDYEALDLETIDRILSGEENRTSESFEAVGIKFPAEATARWGIFLIIGIQIYLCLHLYELPVVLIKENESHIGAWIGLYQSRYARIAYFMSTVFLPVISILMLVARPWLLYGNRSTVQLAIGGLCAIGSATLAVLGWKLCRKRLRSL